MTAWRAIASARLARDAIHGQVRSVLERFRHELLNFLSRQVKDRETAADLVQESYARVLAVQHAGHTIADPRALLYRTARNLVIDEHRRSELRRHQDFDALAETDRPQAAQHLRPDEILSYEQHARAIVAAIEDLPPRCRTAFVLNRFEGLSHQEVALRMGISKNMVAQHVARAVLACLACEERLAGRAPPAAEQRE